MYERLGKDHVSVGMRKPNGEYERPIPGTRLFRTQPGNVAVGSCFKTYSAFTIIKVKPWSTWLIAAGAYSGFCSMKPLDGMLVQRSLPRNTMSPARA